MAAVLALLLFECLIGFVAIKENSAILHGAPHAKAPILAVVAESARKNHEANLSVDVIWERWAVVIGALQTIALIVTFLVMMFVAVRQLRAYVSVSVKFISTFNDTSRPFARLEYRNAGVTPARDLSTMARFIALDYPLPGGYIAPPFDEKASAKSSIFPNAILTGRVGVPRPFTSNEINDIVRGRKRIYVYGLTNYKDIFGLRRQTYFGQSVSATAATLEKLTSKYADGELRLDFDHVEEFSRIT